MKKEILVVGLLIILGSQAKAQDIGTELTYTAKAVPASLQEIEDNPVDLAEKAKNLVLSAHPTSSWQRVSEWRTGAGCSMFFAGVCRAHQYSAAASFAPIGATRPWSVLVKGTTGPYPAERDLPFNEKVDIAKRRALNEAYYQCGYSVVTPPSSWNIDEDYYFLTVQAKVMCQD